MNRTIYSPNHRLRLRVKHDPVPENPRDRNTFGTMVCWHSRYNLGDEQPGQSPDDYLLSLAEEFDPDIERRIDAYAEEMWIRLKLNSDWSNDEARLRAHAAWVESFQFEQVDAALAGNVFWLPLYLYDHGGLTMRPGPFSCPWDSGQVGLIYVTKQHADQVLPKLKGETQVEWEQRINGLLRVEVADYDQFLTGEVYGYLLESLDVERMKVDESPEDFDDEPFMWRLEDSGWGFVGDDLRTNGMLDHLESPIKDWVSHAL
ncbi:hypothetical protein [Chromohalobacter japonicus]|uniref:hypothetical protein n=1 Tax=Chromohalobacter japonicus TaxID=223900 RepID=UPI001FF23096|nr:hypothetical protein [Chromohalobacter japonicus]MCK0754277.1 hypothetical protein [Chromohalobacter japonicus]